MAYDSHQFIKSAEYLQKRAKTISVIYTLIGALIGGLLASFGILLLVFLSTNNLIKEHNLLIIFCALFGGGIGSCIAKTMNLATRAILFLAFLISFLSGLAAYFLVYFLTIFSFMLGAFITFFFFHFRERKQSDIIFFMLAGGFSLSIFGYMLDASYSNDLRELFIEKYFSYSRRSFDTTHFFIPLLSLMGGCLGGYLGFLLGKIKAESLNVQANMAFCQLKIERNTRPEKIPDPFETQMTPNPKKLTKERNSNKQDLKEEKTSDEQVFKEENLSKEQENKEEKLSE